MLLPSLLLTLLLASPTSISLKTASSTAQDQLTHASLTVGEQSLDVQVAADESSRARGLMNQLQLPDGKGMLFVFPKAQHVVFWMKNTPLPLSIAYISSNGRIVELHDLTPFSEKPVPSSSKNITYALEVPRGWFSKNTILAGDIIHGLPSPNISELAQ